MRIARCLQDWLYDEGEDEVKSVYTAKLNELKALGAPVEGRYREATQRPAAIASLTGTAQSFITFAQTTDPAYSHISPEERQSVGPWLPPKVHQRPFLGHINHVCLCIPL